MGGKHDSLFLDILTKCGRPEIFLDEVFGFLQRRTDFYVINDGENPASGMPKGYAAKVASGIFTKYQRIEEERRRANGESIGETPEGTETAVPPISSEVEILSVGDEEATIRKSNDQVIVELPGDSASGNSGDMHINTNMQAEDAFNGADCGTHQWSQQELEIDIKVPIDGRHKKANVISTKTTLKVTALVDGSPTVLVEGKLLKPVKDSETIWTVAAGEYIHISLEKCAEHWWDSLFEDDKKIDLKKLDITKPYEDLDENTKMKIAELTRKKNEVSQKVSQQKNDMLEKAWNLEGSPFKGKPFDPEAVDFGS